MIPNTIRFFSHILYNPNMFYHVPQVPASNLYNFYVKEFNVLRWDVATSGNSSAYNWKHTCLSHAYQFAVDLVYVNSTI